MEDSHQQKSWQCPRHSTVAREPSLLKDDQCVTSFTSFDIKSYTSTLIPLSALKIGFNLTTESIFEEIASYKLIVTFDFDRKIFNSPEETISQVAL